MTSLYLRQKVFSWKDRFTVKGEDGSDRYWVEGEFLSIGKKLHVHDMTGVEVAFIRQKVWSFRPRFYVDVQGVEVAEIVREFALRPRYTIQGLGWEVQGDFWGHNYEITSQGRSVVRVQKAWMSWGDSYRIDILDNRDEINALAVVLAIDAVLSQETAAASAAN
ncbi:MAG: LURP-one-related family protein [Oscillospiraceae bacterium]|nr:LURP-one-related family protein [Oscillospiraceae bacterium]